MTPQFNGSLGLFFILFGGGLAALLSGGLVLYRRQARHKGQSTLSSKLVIIGLLALFGMLYMYFNYFYQRP